jgi:hypothetical protein
MTYISKSADALNGYHFFFIGFLFIAALSCPALPANAQVTLHVTNSPPDAFITHFDIDT